MDDVPLAVEWDEGDVHWTELPDHVLNEFAERGNHAFSFGNDESYRFYLPYASRIA